MSANSWKRVLSKLEIAGGRVNPITTKEISQFEASTGFLLPKGYHEYCVTIGPGRLVSPTNYCICAPGAKQDEYNLVKFNQAMKVIEGVPLEITDQYSRGWLFAVDIGNRLYFWDPQEVTQPDSREYAIYVLEDYETLTRLSDTFWDFINNICLSDTRPDGSKREIELVFEPGR